MGLQLRLVSLEFFMTCSAVLEAHAPRYNIIVINDGFQGALHWAMMPRDSILLAPNICKSFILGVTVTLAMFVSILNIFFIVMERC